MGNPTEDLRPHIVERLAPEDMGEDCHYQRPWPAVNTTWKCKASAKYLVDGRPFCGKHTPGIGRLEYKYYVTPVKWLMTPK